MKNGWQGTIQLKQVRKHLMTKLTKSHVRQAILILQGGVGMGGALTIYI